MRVSSRSSSACWSADGYWRINYAETFPLLCLVAGSPPVMWDGCFYSRAIHTSRNEYTLEHCHRNRECCEPKSRSGHSVRTSWLCLQGRYTPGDRGIRGLVQDLLSGRITVRLDLRESYFGYGTSIESVYIKYLNTGLSVDIRSAVSGRDAS